MRKRPQMRELTLTFALLSFYTGQVHADECSSRNDIAATHFAVVFLNSSYTPAGGETGNAIPEFESVLFDNIFLE